MAESKAAKVASGWNSRKQRHERADLKDLPKKLQDAILSVEEASHDIAERVELAEELWETDPDHELALDPDSHPQTSWAQRFEFIDGECIEITKESAESPVTLTYRPDLVDASEVDPRSALESRLQTPLSEDEKGEAQHAAEEVAAEQARKD